MKRIRQLIFEVAADTPGVGQLEETLKWGEPGHVTAQSGSGSKVRIDRFDDHTVAFYLDCRTMLLENFRSSFGDELTYSKNRAILFDVNEPLPEEIINTCVQNAFCYHMNKKIFG